MHPSHRVQSNSLVVHWLNLRQAPHAEQTSDEENQETSVVISRCRNAGKKVNLASTFLRLSDSPTSAFWHQGQSGTAGHGLCLALPSYDSFLCRLAYSVVYIGEQYFRNL